MPKNRAALLCTQQPTFVQLVVVYPTTNIHNFISWCCVPNTSNYWVVLCTQLFSKKIQHEKRIISASRVFLLFKKQACYGSFWIFETSSTNNDNIWNVWSKVGSNAAQPNSCVPNNQADQMLTNCWLHNCWFEMLGTQPLMNISWCGLMGTQQWNQQKLCCVVPLFLTQLLCRPVSARKTKNIVYQQALTRMDMDWLSKNKFLVAPY